MNVKPLPFIQQQFGLQLIETRLPLVEPRPLDSSSSGRALEPGLSMVFPTSNERTRSECVVAQIMLGIALTYPVSYFSGYPFEVDPALGLVGECEYLLSRSSLTFRIHPPVALIVEVKRDLSRCLSHCLVELAAAQQFNGSASAVYGVLTTEFKWQFLKLEERVATVESMIYELEPVERIESMQRFTQQCFGDCTGCWVSQISATTPRAIAARTKPGMVSELVAGTPHRLVRAA